MEEGYKKYRRKGHTLIKPWTPETDMFFVSISPFDRVNGSPKQGDVIATDPGSPGDQWLINSNYFKEHFTELKESPSNTFLLDSERQFNKHNPDPSKTTYKIEAYLGSNEVLYRTDLTLEEVLHQINIHREDPDFEFDHIAITRHDDLVVSFIEGVGFGLRGTLVLGGLDSSSRLLEAIESLN